MASPLHIVSHSENPTTGGEKQHPDLSLEDLFRQHFGYIAAVIYKIVGNAADTEDLVQEVFLDVQRGLSKLRDPASVRTWLTTIAIRRARRYLIRRRFERMIGLDDLVDYTEMADNTATPEQRGQIAVIYGILDNVSPKKRIAWVLRKVQNETMTHITAALKCSRATAHRWIADVQGEIEEVAGDED